jgi:hypothetical protein
VPGSWLIVQVIILSCPLQGVEAACTALWIPSWLLARWEARRQAEIPVPVESAIA